jgi:hypothetical protein
MEFVEIEAGAHFDQSIVLFLAQPGLEPDLGETQGSCLHEKQYGQGGRAVELVVYKTRKRGRPMYSMLMPYQSQKVTRGSEKLGVHVECGRPKLQDVRRLDHSYRGRIDWSHTWDCSFAQEFDHRSSFRMRCSSSLPQGFGCSKHL